jgi:hypothetical protein
MRHLWPFRIAASSLAIAFGITGCSSDDSAGSGGTAGTTNQGGSGGDAGSGGSSGSAGSAGSAGTSGSGGIGGAAGSGGTGGDPTGLCDDSGTPTPFEKTLIELPPNSWYEAPGTELRSVCVPDSVGVRGVVGCPAVISAWSGGAYDPVRRRMILWGGGHDDYWGNELYGFDLATGTWSRLTEPSTIPTGTSAGDFLNRDPLPDGQPVSRHTYDGVEYIAHLDALLGQGGARARDGGGTARTWLFDFATDGWSTPTEGPGGYSQATAYDEATRTVLVNGSESLHLFDVDANSWSSVPGFGFPPLWPRYAVHGDKTGAVDPTRGLFWVVGKGQILVWNIAGAAMVTDDWVTTGGGDYTNADRLSNHPEQVFISGGGDVYNVSAPGFDYDRAADAFVAWPNEGEPYVLDLASKAWTTGNPDGAPTSHTSGGTFGRWRYVDAYNVFILVTSVDENVYFYKHTAGCGPQ